MSYAPNMKFCLSIYPLILLWNKYLCNKLLTFTAGDPNNFNLNKAFVTICCKCCNSNTSTKTIAIHCKGINGYGVLRVSPVPHILNITAGKAAALQGYKYRTLWTDPFLTNIQDSVLVVPQLETKSTRINEDLHSWLIAYSNSQVC